MSLSNSGSRPAFFGVLVSTLLAIDASLGDEPLYLIEALPAPDGATGNVHGYAVNASGLVLGRAHVGGQARPVTWHEGTPTVWALPEGVGSGTPSIGGLNAGGAFVYDAGALGGGGRLAFRAQGGSYTALEPFDYPNAQAFDMNVANVAVGLATFVPPNETHACRWDGTTPTDLGIAGAAWAINDAGTIVGAEYISIQTAHAFIYRGGVKTRLDDSEDDTYAVDVNEHDQVLVHRYDPFPSGHLWLDEPAYGLAAGMHSLGTLGGDRVNPKAINDQGVAVGSATIVSGDYRAWAWIPETGLIDLNDHIPAGSGWTLTWAFGINDAGLIVGVGYQDGSSDESAFLLRPNVDTDGDGLFDDWERNGIPYVADGASFRYILDADGDGQNDADPDRIDVFVEIDAMADEGLAPTPADLQRVVDAFARAPVANPDGSTGVRLHLDWSDLATPTEGFPSGLGAEFEAYKAANFGTAESAAKLTAKRKAYRYCVFGLSHSGGGSSGVAELGGNDFMVTLGLWSHVGGTSQQKAGTFMHELGHTLGLRHSGPFDKLSADERAGPDRHYNLKPNYYSVMNYNWQSPLSWHSAGSWPLSGTGLGYSGSALLTLDESDLDETVGIVPSQLSKAFPAPGFIVPFNVETDASVDPDTRSAIMAVGQGVDWNDDGQINEYDPGALIARDINRVRVGWPASADTVLGGYADWPHLDYDFRDSPFYDEGAYPKDPEQEMTFEDHVALNAALPPRCAGDITLSGSVDVADLLELLAAWGPCDAGVACVQDLDENARVDVGDLLLVLAGWGPCS